MQYNKIVKATFLERPNRFIAYCEIEGTIHKVHVKNTGRCKELLVPGTSVYLDEQDLPTRKTKYDLIGVYKGDRLINMDSQAPNVVVQEALEKGLINLPGVQGAYHLIKREHTYGQSRFDFYIETVAGEKILIEVKGVTLEEEGIVRFPDAKTTRGKKHVLELVEAKKEGYSTFVLFVIQMDQIAYFTPHEERDPEFAAALRMAQTEGVEILAYNSQVTASTLDIYERVEVRL